MCEYAAHAGLRIAREFEDAETAKHQGRTAFGEMIRFFRENPDCRILLVEKTDRLYRNLKDWVTIDELDLEIHFVKENVVLTKDSKSHEKLMHGIKVLMAKNYIDNLAEEAGKGMREKAEQGLWPSYAPIGYVNTAREDGKRVIEPDPATAPIITQLFKWYATGNHSLEELTRMAESAGLRSKKGHAVPKPSIHRILQNRIYYGDFTWKGRVYEGTHMPLVSRDLWEHAQEVLADHSGGRRRTPKPDFAFSGVIRCGHCGCSLVAERKKGKYIYYHCTGYKGKCGEPYAREELLEERFSDLLRGLSFSETTLEWVTEALRQSHKDEKQHHAEAVERLQAEFNRLRDRIDAAYEDKLDGRIDGEYFDRKESEWRTEQARVLRDIERHKAASESYIEEGVRVLELAARAHRLFLQQKPAEKRRLLKALLSNCTWANGELHAEFRQPFNMIAVTAEEHRRKKAAGASPSDLLETWRGRRDSNSRPPA